MRVQSYVWTGISVHVHVFSKNVEWFTMDYTSHTIPERNIEVNKFPRLLFCYVFGVCVCVCVCVWQLRRRWLIVVPGRPAFDMEECTNFTLQRCPTATTTGLPLCLAQQREDISLKPMMPCKTKTRGRQHERYWQYQYWISYACYYTVYIYIICICTTRPKHR